MPDDAVLAEFLAAGIAAACRGRQIEPQTTAAGDLAAVSSHARSAAAVAEPAAVAMPAAADAADAAVAAAVAAVAAVAGDTAKGESAPLPILKLVCRLTIACCCNNC
jgi:hypothetical protein